MNSGRESQKNTTQNSETTVDSNYKTRNVFRQNSIRSFEWPIQILKFVPTKTVRFLETFRVQYVILLLLLGSIAGTHFSMDAIIFCRIEFIRHVTYGRSDYRSEVAWFEIKTFIYLSHPNAFLSLAPGRQGKID